jgi:two-component system sensor histidine kinase/response regulator
MDFQVDPLYLETLMEGETQYVKDLASAQMTNPTMLNLKSAGLRAVVNAPLFYDSELIGSLNIAGDQPSQYSQSDIDIINMLATQLAIAIRQARLFEQIQGHTEELEQRVRERTSELTGANQRLLALSKIKDEFVANVSHELRTPITSLKLFHELITEQPEKYDDYIATINRETDRLEYLIEDLLTLSRIDQNRMLFSPEPVYLNEIAREFVVDRRPLAKSRSLSLEISLMPNLPTIAADPNLIGQVLSILVTNALSYTQKGGKVTVGTNMKQEAGFNYACIFVGDNGPGIPPEDIQLLFTRFFRGKAGRESGESGTGLGLAIAKEIVDLHQGRIEVESNGIPGEGSLFTLWFPLAPE